MRKYRGKTKDGKWVEGWYVNCRCHSYILPVHDEKDDCPTFDERWIQKGADDDGWIEVIPASVGQSTGLQAKNGVEIYEGDYVHIWSDFYKKDMPKAEVFWNKKNTCFDTKESRGLYHNWLPNGNHQGWFIEVIGNTTDTPELLGVKDAERTTE